MKKTLLTLAVLAGVTTFGANAEWTRVTSTDQLKANVDYIVVADYYSTVMTTDGYQSETSSYRTGEAVSIANGKITEVPTSAARIRLDKYGDSYSLYQVNGTGKGFLGPTDATHRTLGMTQLPTMVSIRFMTESEAAGKVDDSGKPSIFSEGDAVITGLNQSTHNILSLFSNAINGVSTPTYQFMEQADQPVSLYVNSSDTGNDFIAWKADPANGTAVTEADSFVVTFTGCDIEDWGEGGSESDFGVYRNGNKLSGFNYNLRGGKFGLSARDENIPTSPGVYAMYIKPGTFILSQGSQEVPSPCVYTTVVIKEQEPEFIFSPADGSEVESITSFTFDIQGVKSWKLDDNADTSMLTAKKDGVVISAPNSKWTGSPLEFSYREPLTEGGVYTFTFAKGFFTMTTETSDKVESPEIIYTLKVAGASDPTEFVTTPTDGNSVKELDSFSVSFPSASTAAITSEASITVTKDGATDYTGSFTLKSEADRTFVFGFVPTGTGPVKVEDGNYVVVFEAGSFLLNGNVKSPAITFSFNVNSALIEGNTLRSYVSGSSPEEYIPLNEMQNEYGINEVFMGIKQDISINRGCENKIKLYKGADVIVEIAATNTSKDAAFVEYQPGASFGSSDAGSLYFRFGEGARLENGLYKIEVPSNFFQSGDELLSGCTFEYSIGIGDWLPTNTVSLSSPNEANSAVVKNNSLVRLYLTPYFSSTIPNDTFFQEEDKDFGKPFVAIQGIDAKATLYRVVKGEKTEVASFVLDSPLINEEQTSLVPGTTPEGALVYMQKGDIIFDLQKGDNEPLKVNGDYVLEMPWNFFRTQDSKYNVTEWPEFEDYSGGVLTPGTYKYSFTVVGGRDADAPLQTYTVSPEAGSYYSYPTVTITYEGCTSIAVEEGAKAALYYGTTAKEPKYYLNITAEDNKVILTPENDITEVPASAYTVLVLKVPENSYKLTYDGKEWANYEVVISDYKVKEVNLCPTATPVVAEGNVEASQLLTMDFTLSEEVNATNISYTGKVYLYRVTEDGREQVEKYTGVKLNAEKNGLTMTFNGTEEMLTDGEYELVLPASLYYKTIEGKRYNSEEQTFRYSIGGEVSSIKGTEISSELNTVYTFSGICVMRNATIDRLKELHPGLYIINGKKVLIK